MNFQKITSTLASITKNNLDTIIFTILVIALAFSVSHLSEKVDEAKTYKAMQQKLIHDYEVEQKYLEDNKASILADMKQAQEKQDALYQEYLKNKKTNEDKLQNADSRLQDLDGCIRLVSFECTKKDDNKNASGGAVSTVPQRKYSIISTAYASDTNNKPSVQSGGNHTLSSTTQSSVGKDSGKRSGSAGKLQVTKQTGKTPQSPSKNDGEYLSGNESSARPKGIQGTQGVGRHLALEMIRKYEGLRLTAYWDHLGYSIGYGTRSYAGEKITKQEAERRLQTIVDKLITRIRKNYPKSSENKIAALTSLRYNCERCYLRVTAKVKKGEPKIEYWKSGAGGRQLKGLLKRREEEVELFLIEK